MGIHFAQPLWLFAGLIACAAALFFFRVAAQKRQAALQQFAAPHLLNRLTRNISPLRRHIKNLLVLLALVACFTALARPQYGTRWVEVRRKGIDILIAVDTSRSMLARDITPDRLERAKLAIRDFVGRLEGDRVGLLPFAGSSYLMCPLTTDYSAFNSSLDSLDTNIIPRGGTDIAGAIRKAETVLANEANHKILILVTDGENLEGDALAAAKEAREKKMTIYTVGVGTPKGELIPVPGKGTGKYMQDSQGKFVTSKLDEKMLTHIAEITGGLYVPLGTMGQGFDTIYRRKLALMPKEEHGQRMRKVPVERFAWPVATALLLLCAEFLLPARKPAWSLRIPFIKTAGRRLRKNSPTAVLALLLVGGGLLLPQSSQASRGEELFRAGQYDQATAFYKNRLQKKGEDPILLFNQGDTAYKTGKYERAVEYFNKALACPDLTLQEKAYYNRGNAQYRLGEQSLKTDPQHTMELWQQALDSYKASLQLKPDDQDAEHNRDLVAKRLQELKKQQKNKEKQKKQVRQKKNKNNEKKKEQQGNNSTSPSSQQQNDQKKQKSGQKQKGDKPGQQKQQQKQGQGTKNGEKKKNSKQQPGRIQSAGGKQDQNRQQHAAAAMSQRDRERRKQGKMTAEEAKNLLNALKAEEGTLNFIPQGNSDSNNEPRRNW